MICLRSTTCYSRFSGLNTSKANEDMGFTNLAKTVSANQDEEVWVEINSYRDRKHMDEVSAKMQSDESAGELVRKFMGLITPGSCIVGELGQPQSPECIDI